MDIKEQILVALGLNKEETVKLEWQAKSEDGTIFVSTAEELEAGVDISVLTEDGTTILLPVGTYKTDTGVSFRVEEEGIVAEVIESETEEVDTVEEEDLSEETVLAEEDEEDYEEEADVADWKGLEKRIENLEIAVAKLKEEKVIITNLNPIKRPISAVADNVEVRNAKKIIIKVQTRIKFNLLYDKNTSLQKKIKLEQLRKETN